MVGRLMYIVDTNIWLELLLEQEKEADVRQFFQSINSPSLSITDFSLYSIGIILTKLKKYEVFEDFLSDTIEDSGVIRILTFFQICAPVSPIFDFFIRIH